jgi:hypothetical protein
MSAVKSTLVSKPVNTEVIGAFYGSDFDADRLQLRVTMCHDLMEHKHLHVNTFGTIVDDSL